MSEGPSAAAWRHVGSREGFEAVFVGEVDASGIGQAAGTMLAGQTVAVEDGKPWSVRYRIVADSDWRTRSVRVWSSSPEGEREVVVESDGRGRWSVDGMPRGDLDGCIDVDLESSACTNTLPVHRLRLGQGEASGAAAAYIRVDGLAVERLEQEYRRVELAGAGSAYDYRAPRFDFESMITFDEWGLVLAYPGIATRVG